MSSYISRFSQVILGASEKELLSDVTLSGSLVIERSGDVVISYAPFEHIERGARIVIVGITPGSQQAGNALIALRRSLKAGESSESALAAAKVFASFSGPMRANLLAMLDHIGLAKWLGVESTATLWSTDRELAHFTSALRYPVFVNGANYNGQPDMISSHPLRRMVEEHLAEEAEALKDAAWIPLGPKATVAVQHLVKIGALNRSKVLDGLPHPSGANAERIAYFLGRKSREALSSRTNAGNIDEAKLRLIKAVSRL